MSRFLQPHASFVSDSGLEKSAGAAEIGASLASKKEQVWCEQAVWSLLNVYEEKWRQLDWGNLKGRHWEEVSASLSCYSNGQWSQKSPMQCKNKIEDLKKKYKDKIQKGWGSSSSSAGFKWPYFSRIEAMFKNAAKTGLENGFGSSQEQLRFGAHEQDFEEGNENEELDDEESEDEEAEAEEEEEEVELSFNVNSKRVKGAGCGDFPSSKHRRRSWSGEAVAVIKSLAETVVRIERSKLEGQRQLIQMQVQAEARRADMEMKRMEMFVNAQLQLAKLVSDSMKAKNSNNNNCSSSRGDENGDDYTN